MMWVWDEACDSTEQSEGFDLQMGRCRNDITLVECNVGVVFFVDIKVFNQTFPQKVVER